MSGPARTGRQSVSFFPVETRGPHSGNDTRRVSTEAVSGHDTGVAAALLDRPFGRNEITEVRHEVAHRVTAAGLSGDRLHGFVLAVNEVITNVVLHAGGRGRIVLRIDAGDAHCAVSDAGPGMPERFRTAPGGTPATTAVGGRGVWLAHQLCDEVTVETGPLGTIIGLRIALSERETPSPVP
jgi:anti-sigma regulatory factor (Ser/Thr protein kinase)